jgi:transmembrane sensor
MSSLAQKIEQARGRVEVRWSEERARAVELGMGARRRMRRNIRISLAVSSLVIAIACAFSLGWRRDHEAPLGERMIVERAVAPRGLTFADGSTATLLDERSRIVTRVDVAREVRLDLEAGGARFQVVHDPGRLFRVAAGTIVVEVLGTEFTVEREPQRVWVSVERGAVRVAGGGGAVILRAGEARDFSTETPVAGEPAGEWKLLALEGDFDRAWKAMARVPELDDAGDLLLAADVARLSRHPADAVAPLRKVIAAHRDDPRAALAAFTLGRVLLEDLGQPRDAAGAFADSLGLAPDGALAADALAREAEAWSRASEARRARECAIEYSRRYPHGARLRAVRRYGGME